MASTEDWGKVPAASPSSAPAKKTPRRLSTASSNACRLASRCSGNVPINSDTLLHESQSWPTNLLKTWPPHVDGHSHGVQNYLGVDATVIGEEYQVLHTIIHQGRVDIVFLGGVQNPK